MNRLQHRAYARLFWEWFVNRSALDNVCEDLEWINGRPTTVCPHIRFYPQTRNEGTEGSFEFTSCMSFDGLNNITDDDCVERLKWMQENCPSWRHYYNCWADYEIDKLYEGVW